MKKYTYLGAKNQYIIMTICEIIFAALICLIFFFLPAILIAPAFLIQGLTVPSWFSIALAISVVIVIIIAVIVSLNHVAGRKKRMLKRCMSKLKASQN